MDYQNNMFPLGLAAAGLIGEELQSGNRRLSEAEKEELIFRYKDAESRKEKEQIKNTASDESVEDEEMRNIFKGPGIG